MNQPLLEVHNLKTYFYTEDGVVKSVDDVSFTIQKGKTLGVVGESGCGKSITSLSIMQLIESPPGKIVGGEIFYKGKNLLRCSKREMCAIRGKQIGMIFQEPMTSLNPVYTVGQQIMEGLQIHNPGMRKQQAKQEAIRMLELVNISLPEKRINEYPHQLSGGMRQRVMIAMALSCKPELLICDEPTTALDVTIQAQILELIADLQKKLGTAVMMITHDLGVISEVADMVMVMYAGKIVEYRSVKDIFATPLHPYTEGLIKCIPRLDQEVETLSVIPGMVPTFNEMPKGCAFAPRCTYVRSVCNTKMPELVTTESGNVRCFRYTDVWGKEDKQ